MKKLTVLLLLALPLLGCPKRAASTVSGTDEERLEAYGSRLEEMRVRAEVERPGCPELCKMAKDSCEIAGRVCEIAARIPDRAEGRCVSANEDCARFNDACASCRR